MVSGIIDKPYKIIDKGGCHNMYRYIGIEHLVANALIGLMKKDESIRKVSLKTLLNYGTVIVKLLTKSGQNTILLLSKESTYEFVHDYADTFCISTYDGEEYIELNSDITADDLRLRFRRNMTVDLAKAINTETSVAALR